MNARVNWCLAAVSIACFAAGVALSHRVEPGVRVEAVTLAGDTPALKFLPADPGPHPVALLAHGITGSKENLFRFGEALAAAGFVATPWTSPGTELRRSRSPSGETRSRWRRLPARSGRWMFTSAIRWAAMREPRPCATAA